MAVVANRKPALRPLLSVPVVVTPGHQKSAPDLSSKVKDKNFLMPTVYNASKRKVKEDSFVTVSSRPDLSPEEVHRFNMQYGSPHHMRSQSVKTCRRAGSMYSPDPGIRRRKGSISNELTPTLNQDSYRLREFSVAGKRLVNRGDSIRRKNKQYSSATSLTSAGSSHSVNDSTPVTIVEGPSTTADRLTPPSPTLTKEMPYRVLMSGAAEVGKTSIANQFLTSEFMNPHESTGDDDGSKKTVSILLDGEESEMVFIDYPHVPKYSLQRLLSIQQPHAVVLVYSIDDKDSFAHSKQSLQYLQGSQFIPHKCVILVGNKTDLVRSRSVTPEEGKSLATTFEVKFIETSCTLNHKIDQLLVGILTQIRLKGAFGPDAPSEGVTRGFTIRYSRKKGKKSASQKMKGFLTKMWSKDNHQKTCEDMQVL